jgi:predicted Rossmann-fold nucleotide-binding protein
VKNFPVILFGRKYWSGMADWLRDTVAGEQKIGTEDLDLFHLTDHPAEAVGWVVQARQRRLETQPDPDAPEP